MRAPIVVNGRFLTGTSTGLHRVARSLLDAAVEQGLEVEILKPPEGAGFARSHLWEQVELPARAGRRMVLSLANTAPIAARRGAVMIHDLAPLIGPEWFHPRMRVYARMSLLAARRAEVVFTVSNQVKGELAERGVDESKITVIRPAVDPSFKPASPEEVAALGYDRPYLLFVGWADPRKDAATACLAHLEAVKEFDHDLVLVGHPHRNFAPVVLPEAPTIKHAGYVDDAKLRALLTGARALVYPSLYEGFGLPPLEAWACGTPAIVGDTPALRESTEGRAVYVRPADLDELADAIRTALDCAPTAPAEHPWSVPEAAARLGTRLVPDRW
ncbi:MAG: mtfA [Actinomycetia bacterium]|nr:mtfA [Actinomycetes bacterium]